jgi:hypothetical protein
MGFLAFALVALGIFYVVIALISIFRFFQVWKSNSAIKLSLFFYLGLFITSVGRGITLYLISVNIVPSSFDIDRLSSIFIYLMIIIPDMLCVCVFIFLVWYFYANFIQSHVNVANDLNLFSQEGKNIFYLDKPMINSKTYKMLYVIIPLYVIGYITVCIFTLYRIIDEDSLYIINSIINISTPFLSIFYYAFLLVRFSGRPYINESLKVQVSNILRVVIVWCIARLVYFYNIDYWNIRSML